MDVQIILKVTNLTKQFKSKTGLMTAVNDISFTIKEGEIVGLLGPNGAGKTTTIQMLLGLMTPTGGQILYFEKSFQNYRVEILKNLNHMSGYSQMPWRLTVYENLKIFAYLYEVHNWKEKIVSLSAQFGVTEFLYKRFQDLSAGQRTRSLLVKAFLNDPKIVLLDEPTASLDPDIADSIRKYILSEQEKRNLSLLVTSHNMQEVEELCDKVVFLHQGKVLATDTPQGLAKRNTQSVLELMVADGLKRLIEELEKRGYPYEEKHRFITITLPEKEIAAFLLDISKRGIEFSDIEIVKPSLEDFFLSVSKKS